MEKYRPSNGTEGTYFTDCWCDNCANETYDGNTMDGKQCDILNRMMLYDIRDDEYPKELTYEEDSGVLIPVCKAFQNRPDKMNMEPTDENQLTVF